MQRWALALTKNGCFKFHGRKSPWITGYKRDGVVVTDFDSVDELVELYSCGRNVLPDGNAIFPDAGLM
ncbi:MAG: hypothetical protein ACLUTU_06990 [Blautia faecis]